MPPVHVPAMSSVSQKVGQLLPCAHKPKSWVGATRPARKRHVGVGPARGARSRVEVRGRDDKHLAMDLALCVTKDDHDAFQIGAPIEAAEDRDFLLRDDVLCQLGMARLRRTIKRCVMAHQEPYLPLAPLSTAPPRTRSGAHAAALEGASNQLPTIRQGTGGTERGRSSYRTSARQSVQFANPPRATQAPTPRRPRPIAASSTTAAAARTSLPEQLRAVHRGGKRTARAPGCTLRAGSRCRANEPVGRLLKSGYAHDVFRPTITP